MQPPPLEVRRFSVTASADVPLQLETNHNDVAVLPDGRGIVYYSRTGTENQLVVRRFDAFDGVAFTDTKLGASARGPFVSVDGQWIGFQSGALAGGADNRLFKVPVSGGAPVPVCALDGNMRGGSWGADNTIVFATVRATTGLQRVSAAGGTPELLTKPAGADGEVDHVWPFVLPDGKSVLFAVTRTDGSSDIALLSLATKAWRVLVKNGSSPRYLPTGHIVYGAGGTLRAVRFDLDKLEVRGDPIEVLSGVTMKESGAVDFAVSTTGTLVYLPGQALGTGSNLWWHAADGSETKVGLATQDYLTLRLSPDERFATALIAPIANSRLWLIDLAREVSSALTPPDMPVFSPVWNPNGQTIAFWSPASGDQPGGMFQISVAGTSAPERLTTAASAILRQAPSSWTPDGRHLLGTQTTAAGSDVFDLTMGDRPVLATLIAGPASEGAPSVSPDGRWVAYQVTESSRPDVFVRPYPNVNDGRTPVSTSGGGAPRWSRDERALYFNYAGGVELHVVQVEGTRALSFSKPTLFMKLRDESNNVIVVSDPGKGGRVLIAKRPRAVLPAANEYRVVLNWFEELKARMK
jgi:Tol biopolymer transport system component